MAHQLLAQLMKDAGVSGVEEILEKARQSPALQARLEKNFAELDEHLPPSPEDELDEYVRELLDRWKPNGEPN